MTYSLMAITAAFETALGVEAQTINGNKQVGPYTIKETNGRAGFHAFNIELTALQSRGQGARDLDFIQKGELFASARQILLKAGLPTDVIEVRAGYNSRRGGNREWVNWPHLRVIEPGTGYGAQSQQQTETINKLLETVEAQNKRNEQLMTLLLKSQSTTDDNEVVDTTTDTDTDDTFGGAEA